jgi:hypothetical protein
MHNIGTRVIPPNVGMALGSHFGVDGAALDAPTGPSRQSQTSQPKEVAYVLALRFALRRRFGAARLSPQAYCARLRPALFIALLNSSR